MKKILVISSFFLILIVFSIIGYQMVSAKRAVDEIKDNILEQSDLEAYLSPYGYTFENPNVIVDPYGVSPLTAMILFETKTDEAVSIKVEGTNLDSSYTNTFANSKKHYIPVYGLYSNKKNKVIITCGKKTKTIEISTGLLPHDFKKDTSIKGAANKLTFSSNNDYLYAVDINNEVRWYLTKKYFGKMNRLENGNYLVGTDTYYNKNTRNGAVEIDLLGKIYKQYNLNHGYYGSYIETDTSLFFLSSTLLEFDKISGTLLNNFDFEDVYESISYDEDSNAIILSNDTKSIQLDLVTKKITDIKIIPKNINEQFISVVPYIDKHNYRIIPGVKFSNVEETPLSKEKIFLVGYQDIDKEYKSYQIKITKNSDNIKMTGNFPDDMDVYFILDRFLDKRIYDVNDNQVIVNKEGLTGEYSIYIKIGNKIYKTNTYFSF